MVTFEPTQYYWSKNCLPCQRRLPSNGAKNYGLHLPRILVLQTYRIGVHVHHEALLTWPKLR